MQIDTPERGFSYSHDAPLDMRMDPTLGVTPPISSIRGPRPPWPKSSAGYGEERYSRRIARAVAARRTRHPYTRRASWSTPSKPHPDAGAVRGR